MAKNCSQCGCRIRFSENREIVMGGVVCLDCASKYRARQEEEERTRCDAEQQELQTRREGVIEAVRAELAEKTSTHRDPKYAAKLETLRDLAIKGTLTTSEFDALKLALLQHWSQGEPHDPQHLGRFAGMYEEAKEIIARCLVAPATAKYPPLDLAMIIFDDCEIDQFVLDVHVDSQARSSALLRSQFRAKFDLETDECQGVSLFQDVNPPCGRDAWKVSHSTFGN